MKRQYSLRKSRGILKGVISLYKRKKKKLAPDTRTQLENEMHALDEALLQGDRAAADQRARRVEALEALHLKKNLFDYGSELIFALVLALLIATLIRQTWFELYEIPTGSMRPTFKELDDLTVTKTAFGVNMPLETAHIYFDPELVQRTGVVIFSGDQIDLDDTDSTYFGVFPYKKRYIKRLIGKPGDSLYFYGGRIYGVDKEGKSITEFIDRPWMHNLEHIPFLSFDGKIKRTSQNELTLYAMNQPAGRVTFSSKGVEGEVWNGKQWVKDRARGQLDAHTHIDTYSDVYGMRNYAMVRLLTDKERQELPAVSTLPIDKGILYLELQHTPSLTYPSPFTQVDGGGMRFMLHPHTTLIPLDQVHLERLMDTLYTARFVVKDGFAKRYSAGNDGFNMGSPRFTGVPDGTYEFYYGKGWQIGFGGIATALPIDHPLYVRTPENIQKLFNLGIEVNTAYIPSKQNTSLFPHRYAYFRDGDLYLMGAPVLKKDESTLINFLKEEEKRAQRSAANRPYIPFRDYGPPLKNGVYDVDFIRSFGVTIPEKQYLVLGDNHAMSADSRVFGFVPEANLQGAPCLIIWPPGERLGHPEQKPYPFINAPRLAIWTIAAIVCLIWYAIHSRNKKRPLFPLP